MPTFSKPAADEFYEGLDSEDYFDEEEEEEEDDNFEGDGCEHYQDEDAPQDKCARDVGWHAHLFRAYATGNTNFKIQNTCSKYQNICSR